MRRCRSMLILELLFTGSSSDQIDVSLSVLRRVVNH